MLKELTGEMFGSAVAPTAPVATAAVRAHERAAVHVHALTPRPVPGLPRPLQRAPAAVVAASAAGAAAEDPELAELQARLQAL